MLHSSPRLKNTCVRQVVLDEWFPLTTSPSPSKISTCLPALDRILATSRSSSVFPWPRGLIIIRRNKRRRRRRTTTIITIIITIIAILSIAIMMIIILAIARIQAILILMIITMDL